MALRNPSCGDWNFEDKLRSTLKKKGGSLVECCSVRVAVNSAYYLLVKASLCLEAAERPQWPRLYLLSRPRSRGRMPSLVGDRGQVLRVLGWALTRIRNLSLVLQSDSQGS